ncbi:MAG: hypothetical protein N2322_07475, partial [Terrimicrobiaceae bacterium]|nr:hypothetical protein [Terrimicrobiaceae bacterium]
MDPAEAPGKTDYRALASRMGYGARRDCIHREDVVPVDDFRRNSIPGTAVGHVFASHLLRERCRVS